MRYRLAGDCGCKDGGAFDLILANLIPSLIPNLSRKLPAYTNEGGMAIISGFSEHQTDGVSRLFEDNGFTIREHRTRENWSAFLMSRK